MLPLNDSSFRISFRPTAQQVDIADPCDQSGENSNLHRVKTSCVTDAAGADDGLGFVSFCPSASETACAPFRFATLQKDRDI
jgi:hypothetical protein